jgi:hypothetical protein
LPGTCPIEGVMGEREKRERKELGGKEDLIL